jgi:hypothetical protein
MKKTLIALLGIALALVAMPAAAGPYSIDLSVTSIAITNTIAQPFKPSLVVMTGVLPATYTATVSRVHGTTSTTLCAVTNTAGAGTLALSAAPWVLAGDKLIVSGVTNATIEIQGDQ